MMTGGDRAGAGVTLGRALLGARALKHRRIQIQAEALLGQRKQPEQPDPQRAPETLDARLGETMEETAHRIGTGPAGQAQQRMERAIGAGHFGVERNDAPPTITPMMNAVSVWPSGWRWAGQLPGQMRLQLAGITDLVQEGDETGQPAEGRDGPWSLPKFDFGWVEKRR